MYLFRLYRHRKCKQIGYIIHQFLKFTQKINFVEIISLKIGENELTICTFVHLNYHISRNKFEPGPGLELGPPG